MFIVGFRGSVTDKQTQHLFNFRLLPFIIKGANGLKKSLGSKVDLLPSWRRSFSILFSGITDSWCFPVEASRQKHRQGCSSGFSTLNLGVDSALTETMTQLFSAFGLETACIISAGFKIRSQHMGNKLSWHFRYPLSQVAFGPHVCENAAA